MDETGAYYTEWSKSERERQIGHINTYTWNLERQLQWPFMQGSKRDIDVKNRLLDSVGEGESGMIWETSFEICTLPDFPGGSDGKVSDYSVGDLGSIPESGRAPGEGNGNPL